MKDQGENVGHCVTERDVVGGSGGGQNKGNLICRLTGCSSSSSQLQPPSTRGTPGYSPRKKHTQTAVHRLTRKERKAPLERCWQESDSEPGRTSSNTETCLWTCLQRLALRPRDLRNCPWDFEEQERVAERRTRCATRSVPGHAENNDDRRGGFVSQRT